MCKEFFDYASKTSDEMPVRVFAKCHRRAPIDVFVNGRKWEIVLCCSKCDRPIATIKVPRGTKKAP